MMYGYIAAEMERYIFRVLMIATLTGVTVAAVTLAVCMVLL